MDQLTKFAGILFPLATAVVCVWMWDFEVILRGLNIQKYFLCYARYRLCDKMAILSG